MSFLFDSFIAMFDSMFAITSGRVLRDARLRASLTQRGLAKRAATAQSVIARIESGKSNPTLETLSRLLAAAGYELDVRLVRATPPDPVIEAFKRDIDRSLLRANLGKSPEQRVRSLQALARLAGEARKAGLKARGRRR